MAHSLPAKILLWPLSKLFGLGVAVRNFLFDKQLFLKSVSFDIPTVVVGNISVGGSGKTPHVEYLVREFSGNSVAVLSRGYRRRTKGFVLASASSHPEDVGDEPYQIFRRFGGNVPVAVCEDRVEGIKRLRELIPGLEMVILDDAFQHRYVRPTVSMVLTEYSRPPYTDHLMPLGRLREPGHALRRADIVVVTKCPATLKPMDIRVVKERLGLYPYQKLCFSRFRYLDPRPLYPESAPATMPPRTKDDVAVSVTGIANPRPFLRYLRSTGLRVKVMSFPDHHAFSKSDMAAIEAKFDAAHGANKYVLTTEKDAVRLAACPYYPARLRPYTYYIPIEVEFVQQGECESPDTAVRQLIRTAHTMSAPPPGFNTTRRKGGSSGVSQRTDSGVISTEQ